MDIQARSLLHPPESLSSCMIPRVVVLFLGPTDLKPTRSGEDSRRKEVVPLDEPGANKFEPQLTISQSDSISPRGTLIKAESSIETDTM